MAVDRVDSLQKTGPRRARKSAREDHGKDRRTRCNFSGQASRVGVAL